MKNKITELIRGCIGLKEHATACTAAGWQPLFNYGLYPHTLSTPNSTRAASHWRGLLPQTVAHWTLFLGYGGFTAAYLLAAFR